MGTMIRFKIDYKKSIEAIVWLAKQKPGINIYHIAKVLFFADKEHLNRYARPVVGDTYIKMEYGPVPSGIRDLITKKDLFIGPDNIEKLDESVSIADKLDYYKITAEREPDMSLFSQSDIECLSKSLKKYGDLPFGELKKLTHKEKSYIETFENEHIDYSLFIDEDNPLKEEIFEQLEETANYTLV